MKRLLVLLLVSCIGAAPKFPLLDDIESARVSPAVKEAQTLAPQAFAEAEELRKRAQEAHKQNDDAAATLLGEEALAAYQHAVVVARQARATRDLATAQGDLDRALADARQLHASRVDAEKQGEELEKRILIAKELQTPAGSGPADPKRDAARVIASKALATQARLLCGAAKLIAPTAQGMTEAETQLASLEKEIDKPTGKVSLIDVAARARVSCLSVLTKARRDTQSQATTVPDALLSELSAASMSPSRDERGVFVTLREAFRGNAVAPDIEAKLKDLGRVAASHADVAVQVVVHDATPQAAGDDRGKNAAAALVTGGAKADKVAFVMAGTRAPIVDPNDFKNRGRNARLEIVFVTAQ